MQASLKRSTPKLYVFFSPLTLITLVLLQTGNVVSAQPEVAESADATVLIERLSKTNLLNGFEIYDELKLVPKRTSSGKGPHTAPSRAFFTANPYEPRYQRSFDRFAEIENSLPRIARRYEVDESERRIEYFWQEPVLEWYVSMPTNTQVCAVRFADTRREDYELRTYSNSDEAIANDHVITHRYHCGTCSSLRNLSVYLAKPDLMTPVRTCARKLTLRGIKKCLMESIGFEALCAETWAYNVAHTRRQCMTTCLKHYGVWRVVRNDLGEAHVDDTGNLNPCLACDENVSGPGFQYAAGRTRRASGLISAIERSADEVYPVDHSMYFE